MMAIFRLGVDRGVMVEKWAPDIVVWGPRRLWVVLERGGEHA